MLLHLLRAESASRKPRVKSSSRRSQGGVVARGSETDSVSSEDLQREHTRLKQVVVPEASRARASGAASVPAPQPQPPLHEPPNKRAKPLEPGVSSAAGVGLPLAVFPFGAGGAAQDALKQTYFLPVSADHTRFPVPALCSIPSSLPQYVIIPGAGGEPTRLVNVTACATLPTAAAALPTALACASAPSAEALGAHLATTLPFSQPVSAPSSSSVALIPLQAIFASATSAQLRQCASLPQQLLIPPASICTSSSSAAPPHAKASCTQQQLCVSASSSAFMHSPVDMDIANASTLALASSAPSASASASASASTSSFTAAADKSLASPVSLPSSLHSNRNTSSSSMSPISPSSSSGLAKVSLARFSLSFVCFYEYDALLIYQLRLWIIFQFTRISLRTRRGCTYCIAMNRSIATGYFLQRLRPPPPLQLGNASEKSTCAPAEASSLQQTAPKQSPARPQSQQSQQAPTIIVTDMEQARTGANREQQQQHPTAGACNPAAVLQHPSPPTALVQNANAPASSSSSSMPPPSPRRMLKRPDPNTETCAPFPYSLSLSLSILATSPF